MTGQTRRVILLSRENSLYGGLILDQSRRQGLAIDGVILQSWNWQQKYRRLKSYARKIGWLNLAATLVISAADSRLLASRASQGHSSVEVEAFSQGVPLYPVAALNAPATVQAVQALDADLLLLGGVGVVKDALIRSARLAVVNAHPGIVPHYRGNYVARWAILHGDPVGITIHLVDAGIDTGPVLSIQPVEIPRTRSLVVVDQYLEMKRAEHLIRYAAGFLEGSVKPLQQDEESRQPHFYYMPLRQLLQVYRVLYRRSRES